MKVYIAGPMRGYEDFNFPAFDAAQQKLEALGYRVISPAAMDRAFGFDPKQDPVTPQLQREVICRDVQAICTCDTVILLPGWQTSGGVAVEIALAKFLGIEAWQLEEFLGMEGAA